jgi:hypothetical protein
MSILDDWVNPYYLSAEAVHDIREAVRAKPAVKYIVLDNFFQIDKIETFIEHHSNLPFNETIDRTVPGQSVWLPYDGAVVFAQPGVHYGSELFFEEEWHRYLCHLMSCDIGFPTNTEVKLRWHKRDATGYWIHTDNTIRTLVAICYFNKGWRVVDGGLLQLWRVDEGRAPGVPVIESPGGRLDFLSQHQRIRTSSPGGGFRDKQPHDLVLIDQIVPTYNRLFVCNYQDDPAYHSVTPSNGRERTGFVQWLGIRDKQ